MDVTIVANDTRGGVEPYLALADEAAARGHRVRMLAPPQYEAEFAVTDGRFVPLAGAERGREVAASGGVSLRDMGRLVTDLTSGWATASAPEVVGTDVVVAGIGGLALAGPLADAAGAPLLRAHLQPLDAPSAHYAGPLAPRLDGLGRVARRLSHTVTRAGTSLLTRAPERAARAALGLRGARGTALPSIVYGFSGAVVPVVSDAATVRTATGYWSRAVTEDVDPRLAAFVDRRGPVVSIGFGSMVGGDPEELRRTVIAASTRVGTRVVLLTGWGALGADARAGDGADDVFTAASVSHGWLFPRMSATVHHGGAGTTGAALSAGKPTVIVPFGADQPFWASRAHGLGASPPPVPRARLTADRLAAALDRALTDSAMRDRARALGARLQQDRGTRAAVEAIEAAVRSRP